MSDVTKATTYNCFADIGDGKLYLMQIYPTLFAAQAMARATMAHDNPEYQQDGTPATRINEIVIVRTYMEECERVDAETAAQWLAENSNANDAENVFAFGKET